MWPAASPHLPPVAPVVYTYRMKRISIIGAVALGVTLVWACSSAVEEFVRTPDASAGGTVSTSGERLQIRPIVYEGDDGSIIHMGEEIFDTELGVVCEPMLAADGVVRCLPKQRFHEGVMHYADADCTVPAYSIDMTSCEDEFLTVRIPGDSCGSHSSARHAVHRIGTEDKTIHVMVNGECREAQGPVKELTEVPAREFAQLKRAE